MLLDNELMRKIFGEVEIETMIKKMEGIRLKQTERNYLYRSIRPKLIAASILAKEDILSKINKGKREDHSLIEYNLDRYGYKMFGLKKKRARNIPIEELIVEILVKYPKARFIEAIPFIIIKNRINKFKLLEFASRYGVKNKVGYLLETALMIRPMRYLKDVFSYLAENKDRETTFLVRGDYDFLLKTSPPRLKKWNLLGRFYDEDFMRLAEAYP